MVGCSFSWQRLNQRMLLRHRLNRGTSKGMAQRFCWIFGRHHAGSLCVGGTREPYLSAGDRNKAFRTRSMKCCCSDCTGVVRWRIALLHGRPLANLEMFPWKFFLFSSRIVYLQVNADFFLYPSSRECQWLIGKDRFLFFIFFCDSMYRSIEGTSNNLEMAMT